MCNMCQRSFTATRIDVQFTGMCQVPHRVHSSICPSVAVSCPCCSNYGPLLPTHVRPASNAILLLLSDVRRHCADCNRDIRSGDYEGHECVPSLTNEEERQAAELLKRAISTSPDKGVVQLATGGAVRKCFDWY